MEGPDDRENPMRVLIDWILILLVAGAMALAAENANAGSCPANSVWNWSADAWAPLCKLPAGEPEDGPCVLGRSSNTIPVRWDEPTEGSEVGGYRLWWRRVGGSAWSEFLDLPCSFTMPGPSGIEGCEPGWDGSAYTGGCVKTCRGPEFPVPMVRYADHYASEEVEFTVTAYNPAGESWRWPEEACIGYSGILGSTFWDLDCDGQLEILDGEGYRNVIVRVCWPMLAR